MTGALPASVPLLNDTIDGGNGRDLIFGNNGDDTLKGGGGTDTCDAGGQAGYTTTACEL